MGDCDDLSGTGRRQASQRSDGAFFHLPRFRPPPPVTLAEEPTLGEAEEPEAGKAGEACAANQTPPNRR